jgi:hypothetical protein
MPKLPPSLTRLQRACYGGTGKCQMNAKDQNLKKFESFNIENRGIRALHHVE